MEAAMTQDHLLAGRYEIEAELGRGASATVYRARDIILDRRVALKVLASVLAADPEFMQRFQQEARLAARLDHPHIVTVYDAGALPDGRAYVAMRLLEGTVLDRLIAQRAPLPAGEIISIVTQLAAALAYVHAAGLVHRDVKPGNVMVSPSGWATLTDFGIARALETARLTLPGLSIGTPRYMAPEQVRGEEVSPATDTYALGVIAFEMLAGRPPFEGEGTTLMYKIVHEEPPEVTVFNQQVPSAVVPVLERALAKNPADRWETVEAFAQVLEQALAVAPAVQPPQQDETQISPVIPVEPSASSAADVTVAAVSEDLTRRATVEGLSLPQTESNEAPAAVVTPVPPEGGGSQHADDGVPPARLRLPLLRSRLWLAVAGGAALILLVGIFVVARGYFGAGEKDLFIVAPSEGALVTSPITITVDFPGVIFKPPEAGDPSAFHLHYFIDVDPRTLPADAPLPLGRSRIIHSASTSLSLPLSPGTHTVWVEMTGNDHIPLSPRVIAKTTFTVRPGR